MNLFRSVFLVAMVAFPVLGEGEYRTFTDREGRKTIAKILKVDARSGKVTVEPEGGRSITVPTNIFSDADQDYIKEWMAAQHFLSNSKLRISVDKRKGNAGETSETKRAKPTCYYEIELENRSGTAFEGVWIEYCMYMNTEDLNGGTDKLTVESERLSSIKLPEQGKHLETTKEVKLFRYYSEQHETSYDSSGFPSHSTSYNKTSEDNMEGIRFRVYLKTATGNTFMREICEPASIEKKYSWQSPSTQSASSGKKRNNR